MGNRCQQCASSNSSKTTAGDATTEKKCPDTDVDPLAPTYVPEVPKSRPKGEKVLKAMARMGNQRPSGGFNSEEGRYSASNVKNGPVMMVPPCETVKDGLWSIKGIYEHQGMKIGLRRLDQIWAGVDIDVYPTGKSALLKETLFRSLFSGVMEIQAIPGNDISAAQPDIHRLSLVQLLRLRVILIDFVPSGGNGLSSGAAEAFIRTLDSTLFDKLGQRIANVGITGSQPSNFASLGRESVMMMGAAGAVTSLRWWVWWVPGSDNQRVFFDAQDYTIVEAFPADGALEITIFSKPDTNDATGMLRWMDWQVRKIVKEDDLKPECPRKNGGVAGLVSEEALQSGRARLKSTDNS